MPNDEPTFKKLT